MIKKSINEKLKNKRNYEKAKKNILEEKKLQKRETEYKIKVAKLTCKLKINEKLSHRLSQNLPRYLNRRENSLKIHKFKPVNSLKNKKKKLNFESFHKSVYNKNFFDKKNDINNSNGKEKKINF